MPIRQVFQHAQIRKLSLVELGTHVEVAFVVRAIAHGEQAMVGALFRHLDPDMPLLWDRGFFSSALWKEVTARRVNHRHRRASDCGRLVKSVGLSWMSQIAPTDQSDGGKSGTWVACVPR